MKKPTILLLALLVTINSFAQVQLKEVGSMTPKKLEGAARKIYLAQFRINYQLLYSQVETAEGGREIGGGYRGDATAGLTMGVKGLSEADLKGITNSIYDDFIKSYKSAGYEFVTVDAAAATEEMAGYQTITGGTLSEDQVVGYITSTPDNYNYLVKSVNDNSKEKTKFNGYRLSADLQGAMVMTVNIFVPFVEDAESGASKMLSDAVGGVAKIVLKPYLRVDAEKTQMEVYFAEKRVKPEAYAKILPKENIDVPGVFEEKKYKAAENAQTDLWGSQYGTMKVFNVSDAYLAKTIPVPCEAPKYTGGVSNAIDGYLDACFQLIGKYAGFSGK